MMKGFKGEKRVPEHVPERGAAASPSLGAGLAAVSLSHWGVRQQNETSAQHRRADTGIHEKFYIRSTCDFFLTLNCTCNGVRSFIRNLNGDKVGAFPLCLAINSKKYLRPWASSAQIQTQICTLPSHGFIFSCGSDCTPFPPEPRWALGCGTCTSNSCQAAVAEQGMPEPLGLVMWP